MQRGNILAKACHRRGKPLHNVALLCVKVAQLVKWVYTAHFSLEPSVNDGSGHVAQLDGENLTV